MKTDDAEGIDDLLERVCVRVDSFSFLSSTTFEGDFFVGLRLAGLERRLVDDFFAGLRLEGLERRLADDFFAGLRLEGLERRLADDFFVGLRLEGLEGGL